MKKVLGEGEHGNGPMYCIFMAGYNKLERMDEACAMYDEMVTKGWWPNASTYSPLIQELCKKERVKKARASNHER